ncbi:MAG TPA: hypothetical protein VM715_22310 [Candidatus Acidoferrum sp.]|nr:hypothetical protein [Candidatus Acidoferrum sp.]
MPNKILLIQGVAFVLLAAHDIKTRIKAKNNAELFLIAHEAFLEEKRANEAKIAYLCHLLDDNGIPADEFDLIALNYHSQ